MFFKEYRDLNETYFNLCMVPFLEFDKYKNDIHLGGSSWWIYNSCIKINSYNCSIDISKINYTKLKWNTLVNKYIDLDKFYKFKEKVKNSTAKTLTFNFKQHEEKDGCLIAFVLSRHDNSKPFDKISFEYRVTEIFKKFAVDLILFNKICNELKNYNCDIKEIYLFLPALFYRSEFMAELIGGYFKIEDFNQDNITCNKIKYNYNKYYGNDAKFSNYHSVARKQLLKQKNVKLKEIPIESLNIDDKQMRLDI